MPRTTQNGKHTPIPDNLAEPGLNLRSYLDLPPRGVSLEQEVLGVLDGLRTRLCSREEAAQAILRIIGREAQSLEDAVRRAVSPGQLWADGVKDDHE